MVYKMITNPVEIGGEKRTDIISAKLEVSTDSENAGSLIHTFKDGKRHGINGAGQVTINNWENPYENLAGYLLKSGYL